MPNSSGFQGKKQIEYQPSKAYDLLNKRRYMMQTEMMPMSELVKSKRYQAGQQMIRSSVFANATNESTVVVGQADQKSRSRGTGLQKQGSMDAILKYKDSLQYREEKVQSKISAESYMEKQKQTI